MQLSEEIPKDASQDIQQHLEAHPSVSSAMEFGRLCMEYYDLLYGIAMSLTHNTDESQDLVHDTIRKAIQYRHAYNAYNLRGWLAVMMRRLFFNKCIKKKREIAVASEILNNSGANGAEHSTEIEKKDSFARITSELRRELSRRKKATQENIIDFIDYNTIAVLRVFFHEKIREAFMNLDRNHRITISLSDIFDFSYHEITDILKIPLGTVMSRIYRARERLCGNEEFTNLAKTEYEIGCTRNGRRKGRGHNGYRFPKKGKNGKNGAANDAPPFIPTETCLLPE